MIRPIDSATARAYMARDWRGLREAKRRYWRDRLDRGGLGEALRVSEALRIQAAITNPGWPTEQQREQDLETHTRVAQALQATAPKRTTPAPGRARRIR